jgi:hypothetical protein
MDQPSTFIDRDEALQHIVTEAQTLIGTQNPLLALAADYGPILELEPA